MDNRGTKMMIIFLLGGLLAGLAVFLLYARGGGGAGSGGAGSGGAGSGGGGSGGGQTVLIIAVVAAVTALVVAVAGIKSSIRKNKARIAEGVGSAEGLGLDYQRKGPKGFHQQYGKLPGIPSGGNVEHVLIGELDGRALTAFQHMYMTMAGQTPVPVYHTVYVCDSPPWPSTTISRKRAPGWLARLFGARPGLILENEEFNKRMKVQMESEDFALILLGPEMQRLMLETPRLKWHMSGGHLVMMRSGQMKFDNLPGALDRLRRFWELVPPELMDW